MSYGIIDGFAEEVDKIERIGSGGKVGYVKFSNQEKGYFDLAADGSVMQSLLERKKGKYFYIDMRDVRNELDGEMKSTMSNYMLFALITDSGEYIYDEQSLQNAYTLLKTCFKKSKTGLKLLYPFLFLVMFFLIFVSVTPALFIVIGFVFFNIRKIIDIVFSVFSVKSKSADRDLAALKEQYERMEPAKLNRFLSQNGFLFN